MSTGKILKVHNGEIYFRGITFMSLSDIKHQIKVKEDEITRIESKLKQIAVAHPRDVVRADSTDVLNDINMIIDNLMYDLRSLDNEIAHLHFAEHIIEDYKYKYNISEKEAYDKANIDQFADLKKELKK